MYERIICSRVKITLSNENCLKTPKVKTKCESQILSQSH